MSNTPAFMFYPSDFLVGTADLGYPEVGAYIRLLCYQWDRGSLPNDVEKLSTLCGAPRKIIGKILHKFTRGEDGLLRNSRMEVVRGDQAKYRDRQAEIARRGWEKRKASQCQPNANPMPTHPSGIDLASPAAMPQTCSSSSSSQDEEEKGNLPVGKLKEIAGMDCYRGLDVMSEFQLAKAFYKNEPVNRRMFLFWLNRELRKMKAMPAPRGPKGEQPAYKVRGCDIPAPAPELNPAALLAKKLKEDEE